jgi:putative transposase
MPRYIRAFVPGGSFFFAAYLLERPRRLLTQYIDDLRAFFVDTRRRQGLYFRLYSLLLNSAAGDDVKGLEMEQTSRRDALRFPAPRSDGPRTPRAG